MEIPESETLERAALEDLHRAAPGDLRRTLGLRCFRVGTALVSMAAALPSSAIVINRALGLGMSVPASQEAVLRLVSDDADSGMERARKLGCRRLYTCTGGEAPGDPQQFFRNILRAGFVKEEVRSNFAQRDPSWSLQRLAERDVVLDDSGDRHTAGKV